MMIVQEIVCAGDLGLGRRSTKLKQREKCEKSYSTECWKSIEFGIWNL